MRNLSGRNELDMLSVNPVTATLPAPLRHLPFGPKTMTATVTARLRGRNGPKGLTLHVQERRVPPCKLKQRAPSGWFVSKVSHPPMAMPSWSAMASTRNTSPSTFGGSEKDFIGARATISIKKAMASLTARCNSKKEPPGVLDTAAYIGAKPRSPHGPARP